MRLKRMIIMLVGAGIVFGGIYAFIQYKNAAIADFFANQPTPVITVTAAEAKEETWNTTIPTVGRLRAANGVDVTASVSGVVQEIMFRSGDRVTAGEALVRLDSDVEKANLDAAKAEYELAQANYDRIKSLPEGSVVSRATVEQNLYQAEAAAAQVASLQAAIEKKTIRAPFDGVLGIRQVDIGQYIQPGDPLVNLQDLSNMLADFSVGQRDLAEVEPGRKITATTDARPGQVYEGVVSSVEPRVDPATGLIGVEASLPNPEGDLAAGVFINVEVDLADERKVVSLPSSAISYNLYGDYVYVVQPAAEGEENPTVSRVVVQVGERRDARVSIAEGVEAGQTVVTSGQLKLSNGTPVNVSDEPLPRPEVTEQPY